MAKRGNGEGTIYFSEKLNKWVGQFTAGRKADGRINRKSVYGSTRKEVAQKIIEKQNEINKNIFVDKSSIILIDLVMQLISQSYNANQISEATYLRKLNTANNISKLPIANMEIQKIEITDINNSLLLLKNYSNSVIDKICGMLSTTFDNAVLLKIIYANPFKTNGAIIKPKSLKLDKKIEALTIEEQKLFVNELAKSNDKYKDVFYIALYTGMRIGEILALTKDDINLEKHTISITKTLTKDTSGKIILGKTTKTYSGTREIPFLDILFPILSNYTSGTFLFLDNGNFIAPVTINSHFKKICKDAGIKVIITKKKKGDKFVNLRSSAVNTHMLRHTFATRCIESGMSAVVLSKLLGHADIETTLNTYTSVFDKFQKDEFQKVDEYFSSIIS